MEPDIFSTNYTTDKPATTDDIFGKPKVTQYAEDLPLTSDTPRFSNVDVAKAQKYIGTNVFDNPDIEERMAKHQSWGSKFGGFVAQSLAEIGGGTLQGFGSIYEIVDNVISEASNGDADFNNLLIQLGTNIQEGAKEQFPIYRENRDEAIDLNDWGWWFENGTSLASTLSLLIPAAGTVKGVSYIGKLAGIADKVGDTAKFLGKTGLTAAIMRNGENMRESLDVFNTTKKEALRELSNLEDFTSWIVTPAGQEYMTEIGEREVTPENAANWIASKAGWHSYKWNSANIVFDLIQAGTLFRGAGKFTRTNVLGGKTALREAAGLETSLAKKTAKKFNPLVGTFAGQFTEGIEEGINFIGGEEGKYYGKELLNTRPDNKELPERLAGYVKDPALWNSFAWGIAGGAVFQGVSNILTKDARKQQDINKLAEINNRGKLIADAAQTKQLLFNKFKNGEISEDELKDGVSDITDTLGYHLGMTAAKTGNVDILLETLDNPDFQGKIAASYSADELKNLTISQDELVAQVKEGVLKAEDNYKTFSNYLWASSASQAAKEALITTQMQTASDVLRHENAVKKLTDKYNKLVKEETETNAVSSDMNFNTALDYEGVKLASAILSKSIEQTTFPVNVGDKLKLELDRLNQEKERLKTALNTGTRPDLSTVNPELIETVAALNIRKSYKGVNERILTDLKKKNLVNEIDKEFENKKKQEEADDLQKLEQDLSIGLSSGNITEDKFKELDATWKDNKKAVGLINKAKKQFKEQQKAKKIEAERITPTQVEQKVDEVEQQLEVPVQSIAVETPDTTELRKQVNQQSPALGSSLLKEVDETNTVDGLQELRDKRLNTRKLKLTEDSAFIKLVEAKIAQLNQANSIETTEQVVPEPIVEETTDEVPAQEEINNEEIIEPTIIAQSELDIAKLNFKNAFSDLSKAINNTTSAGIPLSAEVINAGIALLKAGAELGFATVKEIARYAKKEFGGNFTPEFLKGLKGAYAFANATDSLPDGIIANDDSVKELTLDNLDDFIEEEILITEPEQNIEETKIGSANLAVWPLLSVQPYKSEDKTLGYKVRPEYDKEAELIFTGKIEGEVSFKIDIENDYHKDSVEESAIEIYKDGERTKIYLNTISTVEKQLVVVRKIREKFEAGKELGEVYYPEINRKINELEWVTDRWLLTLEGNLENTKKIREALFNNPNNNYIANLEIESPGGLVNTRNEDKTSNWLKLDKVFTDGVEIFFTDPGLKGKQLSLVGTNGNKISKRNSPKPFEGYDFYAGVKGLNGDILPAHLRVTTISSQDANKVYDLILELADLIQNKNAKLDSREINEIRDKFNSILLVNQSTDNATTYFKIYSDKVEFVFGNKNQHKAYINFRFAKKEPITNKVLTWSNITTNGKPDILARYILDGKTKKEAYLFNKQKSIVKETGEYVDFEKVLKIAISKKLYNVDKKRMLADSDYRNEVIQNRLLTDVGGVYNSKGELLGRTVLKQEGRIENAIFSVSSFKEVNTKEIKQENISLSVTEGSVPNDVQPSTDNTKKYNLPEFVVNGKLNKYIFGSVLNLLKIPSLISVITNEKVNNSIAYIEAINNQLKDTEITDAIDYLKSLQSQFVLFNTTADIEIEKSKEELDEIVKKKSNLEGFNAYIETLQKVVDSADKIISQLDASKLKYKSEQLIKAKINQTYAYIGEKYLTGDEYKEERKVLNSTNKFNSQANVEDVNTNWGDTLLLAVSEVGGQFETSTLEEKQVNWSKMFGENVEFDGNIAELIYAKGQWAYGVFRNAAVEISSKAPRGTEYHEAFHVVSHLYLTGEQYEKVIAEKRNSNPGLANKTDIEIEEILANEFHLYSLMRDSGKTYKGVTGTIKKFFDRIYNYIKNLLGYPTDYIFDKIYSGGFNYKPSDRVKNFVKNQKQELLSAAPNDVELSFTRKDIDTFVNVLTRFAGDFYLKNQNLKKEDIIADSQNNVKTYVQSLITNVSENPTKWGISENQAKELKRRLNYFDEFWNLTKENLDKKLSIELDYDDSMNVTEIGDDLKKDWDDTKAYSRSAKETFSSELKLLIMTTPQIERYDGDKEVTLKNAEIGIAPALDFNKVYPYLQRAMTGALNVDEMMQRLKTLSQHDISLLYLKKRLEANPNMKRAWFFNFNKPLNSFHNYQVTTLEDKIKVKFDISNTATSYFKISNAWTEDVKTKIDLGYYTQENKEESRSLLSQLNTAKNNLDINLITEISEKLFNLAGIKMSADIIKKIISNELNVRYYDTLMGSFKETIEKPLINIIKTLYPDKEGTVKFENYGDLNSLALQYQYYTYEGQENSFANTEGSVMFGFNNPNFLNNFFKSIKAAINPHYNNSVEAKQELLNMLKGYASDPSMKYSNWLWDTGNGGFLKLVDGQKDVKGLTVSHINYNFLRNFNLYSFDGVKNRITGDGYRYSSMSDEDWKLTELLDYLSAEQKDHSYINVPVIIQSDSGNSFAIRTNNFQYKSANDLKQGGFIFEAVKNTVRQEILRMKNASDLMFTRNLDGSLKIKEGLDISKLQNLYHYKLDKQGNPMLLDSNGYPTGNVFRFQNMILEKDGQFKTLNDIDSLFYNGVINLGYSNNNTTSENPDNYTNHSGGATGADTQWDILGRRFGINKHNHYREPGKSGVDSAVLRNNGVNSVQANQEDYNEGIQKATKAASDLGRRISQQYGHYQYRNWLQVKYSDGIFAVSTMLKAGDVDKKGYTAKNTQVEGGTGYAVQMGINEGKPVYVFDQKRNAWYSVEYTTDMFGKKTFSKWVKSETPVLTKNFAGIGTREINENGIKAIQDVYKKTFEKKVESGSTVNNTLTASQNAELNAYISEFIAYEIADTKRNFSKYADTLNQMQNERGKELLAVYNNDFDKFIAEFAMNHYISNVEQYNFFIGVIAEYKSTTDTNKRAKEISSPIVSGDLEVLGDTFQAVILKDIKLMSNTIGSIIDGLEKELKKQNKNYRGMDVEADNIKKKKPTNKLEEQILSIAGGYLSINTTDAQGFVTLKRYRAILSSFGRMFQDTINLLDKVEKGEQINIDDYQRLLVPLKPFYYGRFYDEYSGRMMSRQVKLSVFPLINNLVKGSELETLRDYAEANNVDEIYFESAIKVGATDITNIADSNGRLLPDFATRLKPQTLFNKFWGLQLDVVQHTMDAKNKLGIQMAKIIPSGLSLNEDYELDGKKVSGDVIKKEWHDVLAAHIEESALDLLKQLKAKQVVTKTSAKVSNDKIIVSNDKYTRSSVEKDSNTMYIFTDNNERTSAPSSNTENVDKTGWYYKKYKDKTNKPLHYGTINNPTSAVIRGLNNAFPISTMSAYGTNWTNDNFDLFKSVINDEIQEIKNQLGFFDNIKIGNYRIGQGGLKAKLPKQHQDYLDSKLLELGIDNTKTNPSITNSIKSEESKSINITNSKWIIDSNSKEIKELLLKELKRRNLAQNYSDALEYNRKGEFNLPLFYSAMANKFESLLSSLFKNNVTDLKTAGSHLVLGSTAFLTKSNGEVKGVEWSQKVIDRNDFNLKSVQYDNDKTIKAEAIMPRWTKKFFKDGQPININELPEDVRTFVMNRIPTESKHSIIVLEAVGFMPAELDALMIVPDDIVNMMGSDFDVDSGYNWHYNVETKDNKVQVISYDTSKKAKENSKQQRENRLLDLTLAIMLSPYTFIEQLTPSSFDDLTTAKKELQEIRDVDESNINPNSVNGQLKFRSAVIAGRALKGLAASMNGILPVYQDIGAKFEKNEDNTNGFVVKYDKKDLNIDEVKNRYKDDILEETSNTITILHRYIANSPNNDYLNVNGVNLTGYTSQTLSNVLDIVKEGITPNLNTYTFGVFQSLLSVGSNIEYASRFIDQPAINYLFKQVQAGESLLDSTTMSPITRTRNLYQTELFKTMYYMGKYENDKDAMTQFRRITKVDKNGKVNWDSEKSLFVSEDKVEGLLGYNPTQAVYFSKSELEENIKYSVTRNKKLANSSKEELQKQADYIIKQLQILDLFSIYRDNANKIGAASRVLSFDKIASSPTLNATPEFELKLASAESLEIIDKNGNNIVSGVYSEDSTYPTLKAYWEFSNKLAFDLFSNLFIKYTPAFNMASSRIAGKITKPDENIFKKIQDYLVSLAMTKIPFFSNLDKKTILGIDAEIKVNDEIEFEEFKNLSTANKVFILKSKSFKLLYNNPNHLLNYLEPKLSNDNINRTGFHKIEMNKPAPSEGVDDYISDSFRDMYFGSDKFMRNLAEDLIRYAFVTNGLTFGKDSFSNYIPGFVLNSALNLGEELRMIHTKSQDVKYLETEFPEYADLFFKNNWYNKNITPRVVTRFKKVDGELVIDEEETRFAGENVYETVKSTPIWELNGDFLIVKEEQLKGEDRVIQRAEYVLLNQRKGDTIQQILMKRNFDVNQGVYYYYPVNKLGNTHINNEFTENSVLPNNNSIISESQYEFFFERSHMSSWAEASKAFYENQRNKESDNDNINCK